MQVNLKMVEKIPEDFFCHSRESGNLLPVDLSGFLLPASANDKLRRNDKSWLSPD
ncbi:MAG: hypothetical protein ACE5IY_09885 [bacterium]